MDKTKGTVSVPGYTQVNVDLMELQHTFDLFGPSNYTLEETGKQIPGFVLREKIAEGFKTEDGYEWFARMRFVTKDGEVMFLLPTALDSARREGSALDRPIAVLTAGSVSIGEVKTLVATLDLRLAEGRLKEQAEIVEFKRHMLAPDLRK